MLTSDRPIPCLLGPTASGKTAAALALAKRAAANGRAVEIISIDSALVYRGMDIGTAKPTAQERAEVPHHLIDIIDPSDAYSAAEFHHDARRLCQEILARGAQPLLVGGTMLYYRALLSGLSPLPGADPAIRAALDAEAARLGWPALHARLMQVDPITATRLAPNDSQRVQRALEVWMISERPMSAFFEDKPEARGGHTQEITQETTQEITQNKAQLALRFAAVSLEPSNRSVLHRRIETRFDAMLADGLIEEVAALRARPDIHAAMPSMRCVGYRQVWEYLNGDDTRDTMRDKGVFATRQLCKRQLTWLRSFTDRTVIDCCATDATTQAVMALEDLLA